MSNPKRSVYVPFVFHFILLFNLCPIVSYLFDIFESRISIFSRVVGVVSETKATYKLDRVKTQIKLEYNLKDKKFD